MSSRGCVEDRHGREMCPVNKVAKDTLLHELTLWAYEWLSDHYCMHCDDTSGSFLSLHVLHSQFRTVRIRWLVVRGDQTRHKSLIMARWLLP